MFEDNDDPVTLAHLKKIARIESIYYSTRMSGNRLTLEEVAKIVEQSDLSNASKKLPYFDVRQRKAVQFFKKKKFITAHDVEKAFHIQPRTARALCQQWTENEFFVVADPSKKKRSYSLASSLKNS